MSQFDSNDILRSSIIISKFGAIGYIKSIVTDKRLFNLANELNKYQTNNGISNDTFKNKLEELCNECFDSLISDDENKDFLKEILNLPQFSNVSSNTSPVKKNTGNAKKVGAAQAPKKNNSLKEFIDGNCYSQIQGSYEENGMQHHYWCKKKVGPKNTDENGRSYCSTHWTVFITKKQEDGCTLIPSVPVTKKVPAQKNKKPLSVEEPLSTSIETNNIFVSDVKPHPILGHPWKIQTVTLSKGDATFLVTSDPQREDVSLIRAKIFTGRDGTESLTHVDNNMTNELENMGLYSVEPLEDSTLKELSNKLSNGKQLRKTSKMPTNTKKPNLAEVNEDEYEDKNEDGYNSNVEEDTQVNLKKTNPVPTQYAFTRNGNKPKSSVYGDDASDNSPDVTIRPTISRNPKKK